MKKVFSFFKGFLLAPFIIYVFDKIAVILNLYIPINALTVIFVGIFDIMGIVLIIFIYYFIFL